MGAELPRSLINEDGAPFADELDVLEEVLRGLLNEQRLLYRNENATAIATHPARQVLIVAGPGAGKSHLFMARIRHWLPLDPEALIYVSTFARNLVMDLESEIRTAQGLEDEDRARVTVSTLHTLARSLLERSHGTVAQPLAPHINVIAREWENTVWHDVMRFHAELDGRVYSHEVFAHQFHTEEFDDSDDWRAIRETYATLTRFYNAVGFPDMIVLAREALEQDLELNRHVYWIIDEFQDFNPAEEHLIREVVATARGVLIAGDDEQALYQQLRASLPKIIISYYQDPAYANSMLPYCSRCSYYVCLAASAFISRKRSEDAIKKIYLPLRIDEADPKVQIVATATPSGAVDYIERFIDGHREELENYKDRMAAGDETDPFLLILTPAKQLKFFSTHKANERLREVVSEWSVVKLDHSVDYKRVAAHCAVAWGPSDNFAMRKVLAHEEVDCDTVHDFLVTALDAQISLRDVVARDRADIIEKSEAVTRAVEMDGLDEHEKVTEIAKVLEVANPDHLATELAAHPLQFLGVISSDEGEEAIETADTAAPIELLTMVGAKGLSAQHVILIGCDDVNMKRISPLAFFVALTRARLSLHLLISAQAGGGSAPHAFVSDLPDGSCEYFVYKKAVHALERLDDEAALRRKMATWSRARSGARRASS